MKLSSVQTTSFRGYFAQEGARLEATKFNTNQVIGVTSDIDPITRNSFTDVVFRASMPFENREGYEEKIRYLRTPFSARKVMELFRGSDITGETVELPGQIH